MKTTPAMNIVFTGEFEFPHGMAGTRRVMNIMNGLNAYPDISISVVIMRQSSRNNRPDGVHNGIQYQTIMPDLIGPKSLLMIPLLHFRAKRAIKKLYRQGQHNLLYVYGPPGIDNLATIRYARRIGFKVVFDFVEDDELARNISKSLLHRVKISYICRATKDIISIADGIVVISSHLENKFRTATSGNIPIQYVPISVDLDSYPTGPRQFGNPVTLFYAGSFGMKDGIPFLLDAFDILAAKHTDLQLVLTGMGSGEVMQSVSARIAASPYRDRIHNRGYLDDTSYYATLNSADILCMPRIDIGYAQAGFPFKLGEYLATGKPVIATAVSDVSKILKDRHDALLVPPGSSEAIAEAAEYILADRENALVIGACGRELAQRVFDYRVQCKDLYGFLNTIAGQAECPVAGYRHEGLTNAG